MTPRTILVCLAALAVSLPFAASTPGALPAGEHAAGAAPSWWTPEVAQKSREAGALGLAYDRGLDASVALEPSLPLIRPGMPYLTSDGSQCTLAFVFGSNAPQRFDLISTAGHCTAVGEDIFLPVPGALQTIHFGETVQVGVDWALIDVFPHWEASVDPDVLYFGGPCGVVEQGETPLGGTPVYHVGNPELARETVAPLVPRVGYFLRFSGTLAVWETLSAPGDSGAPVLLVEAPGVGSPCPQASALGILNGPMPCDLPLEICREVPPCRSPPYLCTMRATRVTEVPAELVLGNGLPF